MLKPSTTLLLDALRHDSPSMQKRGNDYPAASANRDYLAELHRRERRGDRTRYRQELIIRHCFHSMGTTLATRGQFGSRAWYGLSQYGIEMSGPHFTQGEAESATLTYYRKRMELICQ